MIKYIGVKNFYGINDFDCSEIDFFNILIGKEQVNLQKLMYAIIRSMEKYHRGDDIRSMSEIICKGLRENFKIKKIGELVKDKNKPLHFKMITEDGSVEFEFTNRAKNKIKNLKTSMERPRESNSVFLPETDVLRDYQGIFRSRDIEHNLVFDNRSYELAKALGYFPHNPDTFTPMFCKGYIELNGLGGEEWKYKENGQTIAIKALDEKTKKMAMIDRLISNGYLKSNSVIFINGIKAKELEEFKEISDRTNIQMFVSC